jgi:FlaA1/EpsC-like NDP-sugar epimerase
MTNGASAAFDHLEHRDDRHGTGGLDAARAPPPGRASEPDEPRATSRAGTPAVRYAIILAYDAVATLCGLYGALLFRLSGEVPSHFAVEARIAAPVLVAIRLGTAYAARLHRWSFRGSGIWEAARLAFGMLAASLIFATVCRGLPRAVYPLEFFFTLSLMAGFRFAPRFMEGWYADRQRRGSSAMLRTIIVGAGSAGDLLARDLLRSPDSRYFVVGFVDDDPAKLGMRVSGKPVLGDVRAMPGLIAQHRVSTVLLAVPRLPAARVREILAVCGSSKASFKIIPASYAYLDDRISAAMLHDLSPDDLLSRDPIAFDDEEIRGLVRGRRALVTGAGGTIGGEICRHLALHGVSELVMVDMNENEMYLGARRLQDECPSVRIHTEVADIRDFARVQRLGEQYRPELVFHAAAHKHVPLMESAPEEAVKNNVFGTLHVALMAHGCGAERLVLISTDKAVNPTSVMGATKRVAELVVRDLARRSATKMTAVRFGNVLGSAGSVLPLFKQQIERGGPVTVTHPDCTRYFMTVREAVGLVLLAGLGDHGDLCVLEMGKPVRIAEFAASLITMSGRIPDAEIPIVYTGLRPGEKLFEELLTEEEEETMEVRNRIQVAKSPPPPRDLARRLHELKVIADHADREELLAAIQVLVPTYRRTPGQVAKPPPPAHAPAPGSPHLPRPRNVVSGQHAPADAAGRAPAATRNPVSRLPGMRWVQELTDI